MIKKFDSIKVYRFLLFTAAISTLLLAVSISMLRTNDQSALNPVLSPELHGAIAVCTLVLVISAAGYRIFGGQSLPGSRMLVPTAAVITSAAAFPSLKGLFLQAEVFSNISVPTWVSYLGALLGLGLMTAVLCTLYYQQSSTHSRPVKLSWNSYTRASLLAVGIGLAVVVSGLGLAENSQGQVCQGWPLCNGWSLQLTSPQWLEMLHRVVVAAAVVLILALLVRAWRDQKENPVALTAATAAAALYFSQALLGGLKAARGYPVDLVSLHSAASVAAWTALVVNASAALFSTRNIQAAPLAAEHYPLIARLKDFLILTKPVIVLLLLVTTYAGMVVGGRSIPPLGLTFWTLLAGAMAAGGSGAINQYIDRELDKNMQRTSRRPLPAGRLAPAEGLAFGTGLLVAAFFIMAAFANLLAAVLSLAGMVYYILIYSILLKKATVQNIVIGGGAGAIPPLVGWAAASGGLSVPSLFLFAIIFLWTPPHFWALALVRRKDYARAGVPMLPVVRGEKATQLQILIYSLELVGLTLLMPLFKLTGSLFLVSAVVLGGALIFSAWRVYHRGGNKTAWMMYRYSSMYLMFIFAALVLDVLI